MAGAAKKKKAGHPHTGGTSMVIEASKSHQIPLVRPARPLAVVAAQQAADATLCTAGWAASKPVLGGLGFPHNRGLLVMVKRLGATAFVTCGHDETPKQLVRRLRRDPPNQKGFEPLLLRLNAARVTRGPYVLDEGESVPRRALPARPAGSPRRLAPPLH